MRTAMLLSGLLLLSACGEGLGERGSVLWQLTADDTEQRQHYSERESTARMQCAQGGYEGRGYDACVQNSVKY